MIEELKSNNKMFGELSKEEQEVLRKAGKKNCLYQIWGVPCDNDNWRNGDVYRLKGDYQPEPEFEDVEIEIDKDDNRLGIWLEVDYRKDIWIDLYGITSVPDFRGLYLKGHYNTRLDIQDVAELIDKKQVVVARFVKNT